MDDHIEYNRLILINKQENNLIRYQEIRMQMDDHLVHYRLRHLLISQFRAKLVHPRPCFHDCGYLCRPPVGCQMHLLNYNRFEVWRKYILKIFTTIYFVFSYKQIITIIYFVFNYNTWYQMHILDYYRFQV